MEYILKTIGWVSGITVLSLLAKGFVEGITESVIDEAKDTISKSGGSIDNIMLEREQATEQNGSNKSE